MNNHHRIGKFHLDLQLRGKGDLSGQGRTAQQDLEALLQVQLLPALEALFDQLAGPDEWLFLDRLDVDLSGLDARDWQSTLVEAIVRQTEEILRQRLASPTAATRIERKPLALGRFDAWLHFLRYGALPLHDAALPEAELRQAVLESVAGQTTANRTLLQVLRHDARALPRLLAQYPEDFLRALAEASTGVTHAPVVALRESLDFWLQKVGESPLDPSVSEETPLPNLTLALRDLRADFMKKYWQVVWSELARESRAVEPRQVLARLFAKNLPAALLPDALAFLVKIAKKSPSRHAPAREMLQGIARATAGTGPEIWPTAPATPPATSTSPVLPAVLPPAAGSGNQPDSQAGTKPEAPAPDAPSRTSIPPTAPWKSVPATPAPAPASPGSVDPLTPAHEITPTAGGQPDLPLTIATPPSQPGPAAPTTTPLSTPRPDTPTLRPADVAPPEAAFWYVPNAGVVLLHPFLPTLFRALELTDGPVFRDEAAGQKAVYLLHYLAMGAADAPEYDLLWPKFLAGWPLDQPVDRPSGLTEQDLAEGEQLLRVVIGHWQKLGNTSPLGLREGFLRRPGKLSRSPFDGWKLQVEQATLDVLLHAMPWGIGVVKLPWMAEMVTVEWVY